jgi:hypothetical protein
MRALAVIGLMIPAVALANGRPPLTNGVHFRPGDGHAVYVATTFGLLISQDDGCTFRWVCEQNLGYGGTFDPKYRIAADGTIFATTFNGLRVSRDGGCSFITATADRPADDPGHIAGSWIDAIDVGPTGDVWVATANSGRPNDVYRSTDAGVTFAPRGLASPSVWYKSLAIAPSRAQRIYASGYEVAATLPDGGHIPVAHLHITDDDGEHWTESPLAGVQYDSTPLVLVVGVHPTNPDIVYMFSVRANPPSGDRLYRSTDGGMTWTEALATAAPILDVTVTRAGAVFVATLGGGSYQSSDGASFAAMAEAPQLACVGQRGDGALFGCGANWEPDFKAVARSNDGAVWDKVFRFVELAGPLQCPAGTAQHEMCEGMWPALQQQFGATGPTCSSSPEPDVDARQDVRPPRSGGCCDAAPGELGPTIALAALCGAALRRRRQGSSAASASRQLG